MSKVICIECPLSCEVEVIDGLEVRGNRCKKGEEYAIAEFTNPERTLTTTVRVENGVLPVIPVRSEKPIPKGLIRKCMGELALIRLKAPIKCGDVIIENILNTGIHIISSRDLKGSSE